MVMNKRGQGLPISFIVIAAIAALVLVLVIAFTIGGFGTFFGKIFKGGEEAIGTDLDIARSTCSNLCQTSKAIQNTAQWSNSGYCIRTFNIDLNRDGVINATLEAGMNCWNENIGVDCSAQLSLPTGELISLTTANC
jgi:hypothetical protein